MVKLHINSYNTCRFLSHLDFDSRVLKRYSSTRRRTVVFGDVN